MKDPPEAIERYLDELRRWATRTNLVGSTKPEALARHVADSLAAAPYLPREARVVDLGSGAGFPGIPLAIARPDLDLTLVEIRERRVHFLRHVVRSLDLDCAVRRQRIEEGPRGTYAFALVRALAPAAEAARLAGPWVERDRGEIWVWASAPAARLAVRARIPLDSGGQILRLAPA